MPVQWNWDDPTDADLLDKQADEERDAADDAADSDWEEQGSAYRPHSGWTRPPRF